MLRGVAVDSLAKAQLGVVSWSVRHLKDVVLANERSVAVERSILYNRFRIGIDGTNMTPIGDRYLVAPYTHNIAVLVVQCFKSLYTFPSGLK